LPGVHVATTSPFLLQLEPLLDLAREHASQYRSARPFPHVVLDDFLPSEVVEQCIDELPAPGDELDFYGDQGNSQKYATNDETLMGPMTRQVIAQLNGGVMIRFLEELTGIGGLVPDPYLAGGGIHLLGDGGFLKVHADFNVHPALKLDRRINLLLYLNPGWEEEWGGNLELWNADVTVCERRVVPVAGRCVIFNTTDIALHGNPQPVRSPDGTPRRSLAFYYYTAGRPREERSAAHSTIYPQTGDRATPSLRERIRSLRDRSVLVALRWLPPALVDAIRKRRHTAT
jgi:hypothetical protein